MKSIILLLCLISFAPFVSAAQKYKHKSEAELARMTPSQRVDEFANEQAFHRYNVLDEHYQLIEKYIWLDGLKALPRIIEIIDEYDPTRFSGRNGRKGERFDGAWMLLNDIDNHIVRLRGTKEGMIAIDAFERAVGRMHTAGYGRSEQQGWKKNGRIESVIDRLKHAKGINTVDDAIKDTFRLQYKIIFPNSEFLEFSKFLTAHYPEYPGWSETNYFQDYTQLNEAGNPLWIRTMKKPERFYEAYTEFKKTK